MSGWRDNGNVPACHSPSSPAAASSRRYRNMARSLTVHRNPQIAGTYVVKHGRTRLALVVPSNLDISLGLRPSDRAIREAVADVAPGYGVTEQTPVVWTDEA